MEMPIFGPAIKTRAKKKKKRLRIDRRNHKLSKTRIQIQPIRNKQKQLQKQKPFFRLCHYLRRVLVFFFFFSIYFFHLRLRFESQLEVRVGNKIALAAKLEVTNGNTKVEGVLSQQDGP